MIVTCLSFDALRYLSKAVLGSLDRHGTYDVSKAYNKLRRMYDGTSMHIRLVKYDHTRIINRQVVF
jgi:hypothetical protein